MIVDNILPEVNPFVFLVSSCRDRVGFRPTSEFELRYWLSVLRVVAFLHRPGAPTHYDTPVCLGQGSASRLTAWRSTCCGVGQMLAQLVLLRYFFLKQLSEKVRPCTFLHSVRRSMSPPGNKLIVKVSRLEALSNLQERRPSTQAVSLLHLPGLGSVLTVVARASHAGRV